nr:protein [Spodoptera litura nucleopolyhedrovirus]
MSMVKKSARFDLNASDFSRTCQWSKSRPGLILTCLTFRGHV